MKNRKHIPSIRLYALVLAALGVMTQVHAAAPFTPNDQPPGYVAPMALSTDCIMADCTLVVPTNTSGGGKAYRPWFENGAYQGDLVEYSVDATGTIETSIGLTGDPSLPPTNITGINWSARLKFNAAATALGTWWDTARKVITMDGTSQVAFRWETLGAAQKTALDSATALAAPASPPPSPVLNFVRGDRSLEEASGIGTYRDRYNVLGDIIHSNPVYVGAPKAYYGFDGYPTFKTGAAASRAARIYVGSNDGMVHAFDTAGTEVYAYIPSMLIGNLNKLKANPYAHTYFVDGQLSAGDAYFGGSWKTVLVGGLGAGGKGIFALDVTDPSLSAETANSGTDRKVLWELNATSDNDLGYTYSKPVIARLNDGKWYAVMGNGYNSVNGKALLYIIDIETGTVVKRIATDGSGSGAAPNGLSSPVLVDSINPTNGDIMADYAYAGDIDGNLWKFDLSGITSASWAVSYSGTPLHDGASTQAITTAPDLVSYGSGHLVYFGTGRVFTAADLVDDSVVQSIYAIYDRGTTPGAASLVTQALTETTFTSPDGTENVRILGKTTIDWATNTGWKINLPAGERLLTNPVVRAERLQFFTTNPAVTNNESGIGAAAWLMEPHYLTGASPDLPVFDLDGDGNLSTADNVGTSVVGGWNIGTDLVSQPVFAIKEVLALGAGTVDTLFYNNLILPYVENCTGNCTGGFVGGHVDVDTDSPKGPAGSRSTDGNGNTTDGHTHEYDKENGVVFMDFFALEPRRGDPTLNPAKAGSTVDYDNNRVTEVKKPDGTAAPLAGTTEFVVVLANADLSPAGTLQIGTKEWSVVDYQNMVTTKLKALGDIALTSSNFKDDDGASLVFTLDGIRAAGGGTGTLKISFDNHAIIDGGLIPTIPQCVWGTTNPVYGDSFTYNDPSVTERYYLDSSVTENKTTTLTNVTTATLTVGMSVSGTGIQSGTTITAVGGSSVTISKVTTKSGSYAVTFSSPILTNIASTASLAVGMSVSGSGIPSGSIITAINSATSVTISKTPTKSGNYSVTFTGNLDDTNQHITKVPFDDPNPNVRAGYRWRNGSLTMQLLNAASHTLQESTWWPQDAAGTTFEGGLWAKEVSAVTLSGGIPVGFTESEGANESGLLYESALFWHYGDLVKDLNGLSEPCYGHVDYNAMVEVERDGLTIDQYVALTAGLSDTSSKVVNYINALNALADAVEAGASDAVITSLVTALKNAINVDGASGAFAKYVKYRGYVGGLDPTDSRVLAIDKPNTGTGAGDGSPAAVTGSPETSGVTTGPNYKPGRRTWTEITPRS